MPRQGARCGPVGVVVGLGAVEGHPAGCDTEGDAGGFLVGGDHDAGLAEVSDRDGDRPDFREDAHGYGVNP